MWQYWKPTEDLWTPAELIRRNQKQRHSSLRTELQTDMEHWRPNGANTETISSLEQMIQHLYLSLASLAFIDFIKLGYKIALVFLLHRPINCIDDIYF